MRIHTSYIIETLMIFKRYVVQKEVKLSSRGMTDTRTVVEQASCHVVNKYLSRIIFIC